MKIVRLLRLNLIGKHLIFFVTVVVFASGMQQSNDVASSAPVRKHSKVIGITYKETAFRAALKDRQIDGLHIVEAPWMVIDSFNLNRLDQKGEEYLGDWMRSLERCEERGKNIIFHTPPWSYLRDFPYGIRLRELMAFFIGKAMATNSLSKFEFIFDESVSRNVEWFVWCNRQGRDFFNRSERAPIQSLFATDQDFVDVGALGDVEVYTQELIETVEQEAMQMHSSKIVYAYTVYGNEVDVLRAFRMRQHIALLLGKFSVQEVVNQFLVLYVPKNAVCPEVLDLILHQDSFVSKVQWIKKEYIEREEKARAERQPRCECALGDCKVTRVVEDDSIDASNLVIRGRSIFVVDDLDLARVVVDVLGGKSVGGARSLL